MPNSDCFFDFDQDDEIECFENCHACNNYQYCRELLRDRFNLEYPEAEKNIRYSENIFLPLSSTGSDTAHLVEKMSPYDHYQLCDNLIGSNTSCQKDCSRIPPPVFQALFFGSDTPNLMVLPIRIFLD